MVPDAAWGRVAGLRPRLYPHVTVYPQRFRGRTWYVLQDPAAGRFFRFDGRAYRIIELLDGRRSLGEVREALASADGDDAPGEPEILDLIRRLHGAEVLRHGLPVDLDALFEQRRRVARRQWAQRLTRPLALRFRLFDPERLLARLSPLADVLFAGPGLVAWALVSACALVLAAMHWQAIGNYGAERALALENLLLLVLIYPAVKAVHELGHGLTARAWGGEVHEMGVMLLVFMPVPYVDVSSAHAIADRRRRMTIGAAGIMVEVLLATLGLFVWLNVETGLARDIAFDVMLIGGLSTVLFNANPLLRFDGYYVLADALEMPNLGTRSNQYLGYLARRYLLGLAETVSPVNTPEERAWLLVYGLASGLYRIVIAFVIALYVAGKFFAAGVLLAFWALLWSLLIPLGRQLAFLLRSPSLAGTRSRALARVGVLVTIVVLPAVLAPLPLRTVAEGVVRVPEHALVRAGGEGFVTRLLALDGQVLHAGQPLLELRDPELDARIRELDGRLRELAARIDGARLEDPLQVDILREEERSVAAERAEAMDRAAGLVVRSPGDGRFAVSAAPDLPGRFVRQGDLLGYVLGPAGMSARVVVDQAAVDLVRRRTGAVQVRLRGPGAAAVAARIEGEVPAATDRLPSPVLGNRGGGAIVVDARDESGLRASEPVFQFDVALPAPAPGLYPGGRVLVRFEHGAEPLVRRWYRAIRRLFMARLQV